jgi:hypothetical protein
MKLTKRQLKRIIREEKRSLHEWGPGGPGDRGLEPDPMEAMRARQEREAPIRQTAETYIEELYDVVEDVAGFSFFGRSAESEFEDLCEKLAFLIAKQKIEDSRA